jgi:hypothetical protein
VPLVDLSHPCEEIAAPGAEATPGAACFSGGKSAHPAGGRAGCAGNGRGQLTRQVRLHKVVHEVTPPANEQPGDDERPRLPHGIQAHKGHHVNLVKEAQRHATIAAAELVRAEAGVTATGNGNGNGDGAPPRRARARRAGLRGSKAGMNHHLSPRRPARPAGGLPPA